MKKLCECGNEGLSLSEISNLKIKIYGKIPIKTIAKMWYALGYKDTDIVCEECILK